MNERHEIAELVPFLANGTLDDAERARVEAHVAGCASCAELLEQARAQRTLAAVPLPASRMVHVQPELLRQYVDEPGALDGETIGWIAARLDACPDCAAAAERLREVNRALELRESKVSDTVGARVWRALAATVLRPAPAVAYLAGLLVVMTLLVFDRRPSVSGPPLGLTPRLIESASATRSIDEPEDQPVRLGDGWSALTLHTSLTAADLADPGLSFRVELTRGGRVVWSEARDSGDFSYIGERAALTVLIDTGRLASEAVHEIAVRAVKPGDPLDGQALFRRTLRPGGS